eukprot:Pgem_evm1s15226
MTGTYEERIAAMSDNRKSKVEKVREHGKLLIEQKKKDNKYLHRNSTNNNNQHDVDDDDNDGIDDVTKA